MLNLDFVDVALKPFKSHKETLLETLNNMSLMELDEQWKVVVELSDEIYRIQKLMLEVKKLKIESPDENFAEYIRVDYS